MISGTKSQKLGTVMVAGFSCPECKKSNSTEIIISAEYFHVMWIPAISLGKKASSQCTCKFKIEGEKFPEALKEVYSRNKSSYKTPWYHWTLSVILFLLIGISFLFNVTGNSYTDPREAMLTKDLEQVQAERISKGDTLAEKIFAVLEKNSVSEASCLTKSKDKKLLVLVRIAAYNQMEAENRDALTGTIKEFVSSDPIFKGKEVYLGILSNSDLKEAKTPFKEENNGYLAQLALYDFY